MSSSGANVAKQEAETRSELNLFARCPQCGSTHVDIPDQLRFCASPTIRVVGCEDCGHIGRELTFLP